MPFEDQITSPKFQIPVHSYLTPAKNISSSAFLNDTPFTVADSKQNHSENKFRTKNLNTNFSHISSSYENSPTVMDVKVSSFTDTQ